MLLDTSRTLKIADFGVARVEAQNPKDMTGETGTLGYMAPEVFVILDKSRFERQLLPYIVVLLLNLKNVIFPHPLPSSLIQQNLFFEKHPHKNMFVFFNVFPSNDNHSSLSNLKLTIIFSFRRPLGHRII